MSHLPTNTDLVFSYFGNFYWFSGVIESIADPLNQGRVQVRCIGYHPDSKSLVPTEDLPWAHVMLPTTSAGVSGIGSTHGLIEGSWVVGFFADGRSAQQPIVMGSIAGNPNPSSLQQTLINDGQSISSTSADGVKGLMHSTSINNVGNIIPNSLGAGITTSGGIDLSQFKDLLDSGVNPFDLNKSTPQNKNILTAVSTSNDLRATQLSETISNNIKLKSSEESGKNIFNFINRYSLDSSFKSSMINSTDDKTVSALKNLNYNPSANTVDVVANYEKALDNSVQSAGLISIEHNNIRRSQSSAPISKFSGLNNYHFVITAQGQVFPKNQLSNKINRNDNLSSIISRGSVSNNIRICLIGGLPDNKKFDSTANFYERFTNQQMDAAVRLITTLLKKYPKAVIDGANNLVKDGSGKTPSFDVTEAFKEIFPNNVNKNSENKPKILSTESVPTSNENNVVSYTDNRAFQDPRGVYPAVNYGQDYSVVARYNALSGKRRNPPIIESIRGNISKFSSQEPRNAVDRTAIGVTDVNSIPFPDWGGEYGMTHVVRETPGGHAIYADDTPGKNRLVMLASTGAAIDMRPDGSIATMSQNDLYELIAGTKTNVVNGDVSETINGSKKIKIAGDLILEVGGRFAVVAKEYAEFISGNKTSITEGIQKMHSKAGHYLEVGRDYSEDIGGNKQSITAGASVDMAGQSRSTITTGTHTTKSNYATDITLGNRNILTRGNMQVSSNGSTDIFSKGALNATTAADMKLNSSGSFASHSGGSSELNSGGKMSIIGAGGIGIDGGSTITLDASSNIKMQEGTIADKTDAAEITTFEYPEKLQAVPSLSNSEANPSSTDMAFGERHEQEAHDEHGAGGGNGNTRSAFNSGITRNTNSHLNSNNSGSPSRLEPTSLGGSASTGCEVANKLKERGMSEEAAAAYSGAFMQESSYKTNVENGIGAYGIAQWTSSGRRKEMMFDYLGSRRDTLDGQLDYVMHELQTNPSGHAGEAATTWKTNNLADAIKSAAYYERFNGFASAKNDVFSGGEWGNRAGYAAAIYKDCFNKDPGKFSPAEGFNPGGSGLNENTNDATGPNTGIGSGSAQRGDEKNVNLPPMADKYQNRNQKISEFFTLDDLLQSGGNKFDVPEYFDTPNGRMSADELVKNLSTLAVNVLDVIYRRLGKVTINSGFRPPYYNRKLKGSAKNSQHQYGRAADIRVAGYSPAAVYNYVINNIPAAKGVGKYPTFTHVDVRPGGRATWGR